jgi:hypothetical protein
MKAFLWNLYISNLSHAFFPSVFLIYVYENITTVTFCGNIFTQCFYSFTEITFTPLRLELEYQTVDGELILVFTHFFTYVIGVYVNQQR